MRKAGAKIGKNLNKKGKGWKNTMFEGRACDENTRVDIMNTKNSYFCEVNAPSRLEDFPFKMFIHSSLTIANGA